MLKLFRMYRFTVAVQKKISETYSDEDIKAFNASAGVDSLTVAREECIDSYKPRLARNSDLVVDQTSKAAMKHGFIKHVEDDRLSLTYGQRGGYRLVEGYGLGFVRELLAQEWKFVAIIFLIVGVSATFLTRSN